MNLTTAWMLAPTRPAARASVLMRNTSIGGLSFGFEVDGQYVAMRISEDALRCHFGANRCPATWLEAYRKHVDRIDAKALAVHLRNPLLPVFLQASDFDETPEDEGLFN